MNINSAALLSMTAVLLFSGPSGLHQERGSEEDEHLEPRRSFCLSTPSLRTTSEVASLINNSGLFLPVVTVRPFTQANHRALALPRRPNSDLCSDADDGYLKHQCLWAGFELERSLQSNGSIVPLGVDHVWCQNKSAEMRQI